MKISTLTALKISALHFWAAHELRSADKELGKCEKNDEVLGQRGLAMVGGGTEGCMTASRRKIPKGQERGLDRGGWCQEKIKANSGSTPGNLFSV